LATKHDVYVEDLCLKIKPDYDILYTNVPLYSKRQRKVAEIDILAQHKEGYDAYEVKCSYRITKAKRQLLKIKRSLPGVRKLFFFCGESGVIESIF
jgi:hypothetical protein